MQRAVLLLTSAFAGCALAQSSSATDFITPLAPEPTYSGITVPPPESVVTTSAVITLGSSTYTTTYASYPNSPNPTPNSANGSEIVIAVAPGGSFTFKPDHTTAKPRDVLVFQFQSSGHSATQSSFAAPCVQFVSGDGVIGANSGFMDSGAEFRITVNDTTPLYFYCMQVGHCGQGMVFAVNTDEGGGDRSFAAFQTLATEINGTAGTTGGGSSSSSSSSSGTGTTASSSGGSGSSSACGSTSTGSGGGYNYAACNNGAGQLSVGGLALAGFLTVGAAFLL